MGRYVWYAEGEAHKPFLRRLFRFIDSGGMAGPREAGAGKRGSKGWQLDPRKRKKIEDAAIKETICFYTDLGYTIKDRQDEHVGWDLEAKQGGSVLKLEVKGISSGEMNCELSANEFAHLKKHRKDYRICIVVNALEKYRSLSVYTYVPETRQWEHHQSGAPLIIEPVWVQTARLTA
jgi:hypothetical protein